MKDVLWTCFKYGLTSVTVMLVTMSFVTGQFPPPVLQLGQTLKAVRETMDIGKATANIKEAQKERQKVLEAIDEEQKNLPVSGSNSQIVSDPGEPPVSAEDRIKSLEYEVALLKSRLYRAEWEAQQLRSQQTAAVKK